MCLCIRFTTYLLRISFHPAFRDNLSGRAPHCSGIALWTAGRSPIALCYRTIKTHFGVFRLEIMCHKTHWTFPSWSCVHCVLLGPLPAVGLPLIILTGLRVLLQRNLMSQFLWQSEGPYETTRRHIPYYRNIVIFSDWWQFILQFQFRPLVSFPLPCWLSCRYLLTPPLSGVWLWPRVNCHLSCAPRHLGRGVSSNIPPSE